VFITRILLTLLLCTIPLYSIAAEKEEQNWYQIELILFKQPHQVIASSEQWDGWHEKRAPLNYDESIELRYPERKGASEEHNVIDGLETDRRIVSLKEAEAIVAKSMQPEGGRQDSIPELQPFTFSQISDWELGEIYERIKNTERYELLIHTAWIQPGLSRDEAVAIHIHNHMALVNDNSAAISDDSDNLVDDTLQIELRESVSIDDTAFTSSPSTADLVSVSDMNLPSPPVESSATTYPLESTFFEQDYQQKIPDKNSPDTQSELTSLTFNGTVKVSLSRYLHFEINLDYAPFGFPQEIGNATRLVVSSDRQNYAISGSSIAKSSQLDDENSPLFYTTSNLDSVLGDDKNVQKAVYRMQESRRMRSRELHYIDHPKIGALIKIVPVEHPQPITKSSSEES